VTGARAYALSAGTAAIGALLGLAVLAFVDRGPDVGLGSLLVAVATVTGLGLSTWLADGATGAPTGHTDRRPKPQPPWSPHPPPSPKPSPAPFPPPEPLSPLTTVELRNWWSTAPHVLEADNTIGRDATRPPATDRDTHPDMRIYGKSVRRVVQCPACGSHRANLEQDQRGPSFTCVDCRHEWRWEPGQPWPAVVVHRAVSDRDSPRP
jgi:hypothetical protein